MVTAGLMEEIPLEGGDVTAGVVRVGDTVRRPPRPTAPAVHALLKHVRSRGFAGAPQVIGVDDQGREILTYVHGETALRPLPDYAVTERTLVELARLLRRYHDAAESFVPPTDAVWESGSNVDDEPELIGHCDVTPENVVFRLERPYALIDFDMARPTTRLFDVVTTLRHWVPLADPADRDPRQAGLQAGPRIRLFCDAYGLTSEERRKVLPIARLRFQRSYDEMADRAITHGGGWARMWDQGAGERIQRAQSWLTANWGELDAHLA
ncbi:aminoglycoside phosphotransferase family protein [Rhizohabitans arisaemae]|uniref:phosphotransferase n=1 Tax=Rhizohabitans arisaemae TaxID=2720610 RepID=UPI0024B041E9|nr:aminoglycoside phosphotransferase family protein [Rhizohabitans arisaemae]